MLEVNNLDVFYGKSQALRDVSLRVDEGEIKRHCLTPYPVWYVQLQAAWSF
jgi:ABC-type arginine transport system ATPase subunit